MTEQGNLKWDSRYKLDTWINCVEMMLQHCYEGHTCHHGNIQHLEMNPQPFGPQHNLELGVHTCTCTCRT